MICSSSTSRKWQNQHSDTVLSPYMTLVTLCNHRGTKRGHLLSHILHRWALLIQVRWIVFLTPVKYLVPLWERLLDSFFIFLKVHFLWIYFLGEENFFKAYSTPRVFSYFSFRQVLFSNIVALTISCLSLKTWRSNWRPEVLFFYL